MRMGVITAIGVIVLAASMAAAQGRGAGQGRAGGAPGAGSDVRQGLYDMADSTGMLGNAQEVDRIGSMNYWATGTIMSGTQACKVVDYKASVNWIHKGMRVDYKCD